MPNISTELSLTAPFSTAWSLIRKYPKQVYTVTGVYALSSLAEELVSLFLKNHGLQRFASLLDILYVFVSVLLGIGMTKFALRLLDGTVEDVSVYGGISKNLYWGYLWGTIRVGFIVLLGTIALVIPGIYFAMKYSQFSYFMIDKGMSPSEAMAQSVEATKGVKLWLLAFNFLIGLAAVAILAVLAVVSGSWSVLTAAGVATVYTSVVSSIGAFLVLPLVIIAETAVYRRLAQGVGEATPVTPLVAE